MSNTALTANGLQFAYADGPPMRFDFALAKGDFAAVMGPSGAGKTTLFSLLCGFDTPISGQILIGNQDITQEPPARRPVSMVFQENNLFAHMDVAANVAIGLSPSLKMNDTMQDRCAQAIKATGLSGLEKRLPSQLSGGQRQRVALARALVRRKPILLLDEAFASLGPALRAEMLDLVRMIHEQHDLTTLMITHFPQDAKRICNKLLFAEDGCIEGVIPIPEAFDGASSNSALSHYLAES